MAFSIKNDETDQLARQLADLTGETITEAVTVALRERLARVRHRPTSQLPVSERLLAIGRDCAALPVLDARSDEEILGYDDAGLPS
jgi:antitoxin VapB